MNAVWLELIALLLLLLINGVFSAAELAIVSVRRGRLEQRVQSGDQRARVVLEFADDPNRFLSTIQIGITLVGVLAGALGGATLRVPLGELLRTLPIPNGVTDPIAFGIIVFGITGLTILFGELVPKRLAMTAPERIALITAPGIRVLSILGIPVVRMFAGATELIIRLIGNHNSTEPPVTDDDLKQLVRDGMRNGVFEPEEHDMIRRVLRLGDRTAGSLMTPRHEVVWLDLNDTPEELIKKVTESRHSCFPVSDGTLDVLLGTVRAKELLPKSFDATQPPDLKGLLVLPLLLFEGAKGLDVLKMFKNSGHQFAIVLDEYGSIEGVLTPNDILEAIVGELPGPNEPDATPMAERLEDGSWAIDGRLPIDELRDLVPIVELPQGDYRTLAGFMMDQLGHIPAVSESITWQNLRFEVLAMESRRIDRVHVTLITDDGASFTITPDESMGA